jgi:hypothetical protein
MHPATLLSILACLTGIFALPSPSRQEGTEWNHPNPLATIPAQTITTLPYRTFIPAPPVARNMPRMYDAENSLAEVVKGGGELMDEGLRRILTIQTVDSLALPTAVVEGEKERLVTRAME